MPHMIFDFSKDLIFSLPDSVKKNKDQISVLQGLLLAALRETEEEKLKRKHPAFKLNRHGIVLYYISIPDF